MKMPWLVSHTHTLPLSLARSLTHINTHFSLSQMVPDCIMKMSWLVTLKMAENELEHITDEMVQTALFNPLDLDWTSPESGVPQSKAGLSKTAICSHYEGVCRSRWLRPALSASLLLLYYSQA